VSDCRRVGRMCRRRCWPPRRRRGKVFRSRSWDWTFRRVLPPWRTSSAAVRISSRWRRPPAATPSTSQRTRRSHRLVRVLFKVHRRATFQRGPVGAKQPEVWPVILVKDAVGREELVAGFEEGLETGLWPGRRVIAAGRIRGMGPVARRRWTVRRFTSGKRPPKRGWGRSRRRRGRS
jgi:hypothetical protein